MNAHEPWTESVRRQLDEDAGHIDAATLSRLNRARQQALDAGLRAPRAGWRQWSLGLATVAAAALLALTPMLRVPQAPLPAPAIDSGADDLELLAAGEDLELIENLEFYAWLEQQSLDG